MNPLVHSSIITIITIIIRVAASARLGHKNLFQSSYELVNAALSL